MNIFRKFRASLQLRGAIRQAETAHHRFGHRFYVMPTFNGSGKLVILDRKNFRDLRLKHYIACHAKVADLLAESFYFTPDRAGNYLSDPDRRQKLRLFFAWADAQHNARRSHKKS